MSVPCSPGIRQNRDIMFRNWTGEPGAKRNLGKVRNYSSRKIRRRRRRHCKRQYGKRQLCHTGGRDARNDSPDPGLQQPGQGQESGRLAPVSVFNLPTLPLELEWALGSSAYALRAPPTGPRWGVRYLTRRGYAGREIPYR